MRALRTPRTRSDALVVRFVLPVSGVAVGLRPLTGVEDVLLTEYRIDDPRLVLALAQHLGRTDAAVNWADLPVSDIDTLIARLRQALVGNRVVADVLCANAACGERVDLSFGIDAYLAHHRPRHVRRRGWRAEHVADAPGWYALHVADRDVADRAETDRDETEPAPDRRHAAGVRFRLPTLADQIAADGAPDPADALAARCIDPSEVPGRTRTRIEAAMAALGPALSGPLRGRCPHCQTPIAAHFDARAYCLQELRDRAQFVYGDVDALAERYHWSEHAILTLPYARRTNYVERARQARAG